MTIQDFIKERPYLVWYMKKENLENLNESSIVEHVLNYGDWNDVQKMINIMGTERVAEIFRNKSKPDKFGRQNYRPEIKHYFDLYFKKHLVNA